MLHWCEYDPVTRAPLVLLECGRDTGQQFKSSGALVALAIRASLPSYTVLYRLADRPNPADPTVQDIESFRVMRTNPASETQWRTLSPAQWATALLQIRSHSWRHSQVAANDDRFADPPLPPVVASQAVR